MKHQKGIFATCVAMSVVLGILRTVAMPLIAQHQTASFANIALLLLTAASLIFCIVAPRKAKTPLRTFGGRSAAWLSATSLFTGFSLLVLAVQSLTERSATTPSDAVPPMGSLLSVLLFAFSLLSGAFFVLYGILRPFTFETPKGEKLCAVLALAPIVWSWVRIGRYETSFLSSAGIFLSVYDLFLLLSEAVFFLCFARYAAKPDEAYPRATVAAAMFTAILTVCGCLARTVLLLVGDHDSAHLCDLITAPDLGIGLLAFSFISGQWFAPAPKRPEPKPSPIQEVTDEDGLTRFLLSDDPELFVQNHDEDIDPVAAPAPHDPRKPLDWEDILSDLISNDDHN